MSVGFDHASVDRNKNRAAGYMAAVAHGATFCFVRGSYERWPDPTFAADVDAIRAAGLVAGAYALPLLGASHPKAREQMKIFADGANLGPGDFPPVLDVEFGAGGIAATGMSRPAILSWLLEAVQALRELYGVNPIIYTSKRVWDGEDADALDADGKQVAAAGLGLGSVAAVAFTGCPLWLAKYARGYRLPAWGDDPGERAALDALAWPPTPAAWGEGNHWIHQTQGDALEFAHAWGQVDVDRFRPMAEGETGSRVRQVQRWLCMAEGAPGFFDRVMGDALGEFQAKTGGLTVDKIVGPKTFAQLAWTSTLGAH